MPVIADHLQPGSWRYELDQKLGGDREGYVPSETWPEDCMVQWGGGGVVFTGKGSYRTAFFEAFPKARAPSFVAKGRPSRTQRPMP